jgi:hypothetical protein
MKKPQTPDMMAIFRIQHFDRRTEKCHRRPRGVLTIGKHSLNFYLHQVHASLIYNRFLYFQAKISAENMKEASTFYTGKCQA